MNVWIVLECYYDSTEIARVYATKTLADKQAEELGGWVVEAPVEVIEHPDIQDPIKRQERQAAQQEREQLYRLGQEEEKRRAEVIANTHPHDRMSLCHCPVFSRSERRFINDHGYCSFCGGFEYVVFRQYKGEESLQEEIDKLAIHDREQMRRIVSGDGTS